MGVFPPDFWNTIERGSVEVDAEKGVQELQGETYRLYAQTEAMTL